MSLTDELSRGNMQLIQGTGRMAQHVLLRYSMQNDGKQTMQDIMQGGKEMSQQAGNIFDRGQEAANQAHHGAAQLPGGSAPGTTAVEDGGMPALPALPLQAAHQPPPHSEPRKVVVDDIPNHDADGVPATQLTGAELDTYRSEFAQHNVQFDYEQKADGSLEMTFASTSTTQLAYALDQTSMTLGQEPQLSNEQLPNEVDAMAQQVSPNDPALNNPDLYLDMGMNR